MAKISFDEFDKAMDNLFNKIDSFNRPRIQWRIIYHFYFNHKEYRSTDVTEILAFSLFMGEFGKISMGGKIDKDIKLEKL